MNDDDLDRSIRSGIASLIEQAPDPRPYPPPATGAPTRRAVGDAARESGTSRLRNLSVAAAVLLAAALLGVWIARDESSNGIDAVQGTPAAPDGFAGWEPGWHTLDTGPVPAMTGVQLSWTDERLVVAGLDLVDPARSVTRVFSFDPATGAWSELPRPPRKVSRIVAAGDHLVAVGRDTALGAGDPYRQSSASEWATLSPGAEEWVERGAVPASPALAAAGGLGVGAGRDRLVWTGSRVIDLALGAILDPASGSTEELPLPTDVADYSQLLNATPVWTGEQVVLTGWSPGPGLAWNAYGEALGEVPGLVGDEWPPSTGSGSPAVPVDGDVVVVSEGTATTGYTGSLDPSTGQWTRRADIPGPSHVNCPYSLAAVGDAPVVQPCSDGGTDELLRLVGDTWVGIGAPPLSKGCCVNPWLGTDDALVGWSSDTDTLNNPRAPYVEAVVWVPPDGTGATLDRTIGPTAPATEPARSATTGRWQSLPPVPLADRTAPVLEWAGDRLVIFGGETAAEMERADVGAVYDPASGRWSAMNAGPLGPLREASSAWTGTELVICCGRDSDGYCSAAAAGYDPLADTWRSFDPAPEDVAFGTAVWTGSKVLVVGPGESDTRVAMTLDPATGEWELLDPPPVDLGPAPPVVWTGDDAVVWTHRTDESTGYVLDDGSWQQLPEPPGDLAISSPSMVATSTSVIIWGPPVDAPATSKGAVLDRATGEWRAISDDPLGSGDDWNGVHGSHDAVWTGSEMVIWTGSVAAPIDHGDTPVIAYAPRTDTWRELGRAEATAYRPRLSVAGGLLAVGTDPPGIVSLGR